MIINPMTIVRKMAAIVVPIPNKNRNAIVARSARAVIAIGGKYGTLSEIAYALQSNIPIIGLNTWEISKNGQSDKSIIPAKDPAEAVNKAFEMIGVK